MQYAERWLAGMDVESEGLRGHGCGKNELQFSILIGRKEDEGIEHSKEQKTIIESLVSTLPQPEAVPCRKLLDSYLTEVAKDPNLSITKFQVLAEALPEKAWTCDGLYRAIDTYLKVLFCEQIKMRAAMQGKERVANGNSSEQKTTQTSTKTEIMTLRAELENIKTKMTELQREYSELQLEYEKKNKRHMNGPAWNFGWTKIRTSALFHRKSVGDLSGEVHRMPNSLGNKMNFRRRLSISEFCVNYIFS
ncbi:hypothetical protein SADUNF_Sadunf05G0049100 [Salix dunnii]|uniref:NPH3 domain-containing protein n=1 Tax=Salix dunnii TaxID=1413687 RepID=A0A835K9M9_9ROSI|nr:hypothetical protein SADUNF_Sadunf05G0049100 [Salix dunnii]